MKSKITVLITGATGFVGSHLVKLLLSTGYQILAYRRKDSSCHRLLGIVGEVIWYDVNADFSKPFQEYKIDVIVHLATSYGRDIGAICELASTNLALPLSLLSLAEKAGTKLFLNTDTFYSRLNYEGYDYLPNYILSKRQLLSWLRRVETLKVINMRLEHVYGPFDSDGKFLTYIGDQLDKNVPILKMTTGEQKRDFIYVTDVCHAYLKVIEASINSGVGFDEFEIGTSNVLTIKELVLTMKERLNSKTKLIFGALEYRKGEIMESKANSKLREELMWRPQVSLEQGISLAFIDIKET